MFRRIKLVAAALMALSATFIGSGAGIAATECELLDRGNEISRSAHSRIAVLVPYWNWYGFPGNYTAAYMCIQIVGFTTVGIIAALVLGKRTA